MPLLTLFTAPKPFVDPHISVIQRNSLENWLALGADVEVVVIGGEPGIAPTCEALGIQHLPDVQTNDLGTPLISSIFDLSRQVNDSPHLAYSNADILFLPEILDCISAIGKEKDQFLAVGQRYDLEVREPLSFTEGWDGRLLDRVHQEGRLHGQSGSDYFIFPKECFWELPNFAVGRAGWDNWMIFKARWQGWPVIDLTGTLTIIHQNHDYAHLPGGIVHFHQPETEINVRLGGGRRTIFTLEDITHTLTDGVLRRKSMDWHAFWREVEIFPLIRLHSWSLGWLSFALFHPIKAFNEIKGWLVYKLNRLRQRD